MNPVIDNIRSRRSVRSYADKPLPREVLAQVLEAGNLAPSGMNTQGWRFVVVESAGARKRLADLALPRYQKWLAQASESFRERRKAVDAQSADPVYYSAPAAIFVIGSGMTAPLDCPMVCQNMMLAARSLGIGSCWVYMGQLIMDDPEIQKLFCMKEEEKVYGPIVLGYPNGDFPPAPAKKQAVVKWL